MFAPNFVWIKSLCMSENLGGWPHKLPKLLPHEILLSQVLLTYFSRQIYLQKKQSSIGTRHSVWMLQHLIVFGLFFKSLIAGRLGCQIIFWLPLRAKVNESTSELILLDYNSYHSIQLLKNWPNDGQFMSWNTWNLTFRCHFWKHHYSVIRRN